jgi:hypothetical protein
LEESERKYVQVHCLDAIVAKNELKSKSMFAKDKSKIILPSFEKEEEPEQ